MTLSGPGSVLVTGSSGFIAYHLIELLLKDGIEVCGLDLPGKTNPRSEKLAARQGFRAIEADLTDLPRLREALEGRRFERVVHLAGYVSPERSLENILEVVRVNLIGYLNLIAALDWQGIRRFVNVGTCEEYGDSSAPFSERQRESAVSPYSFSKICATHASSLYALLDGYPIVTVRPFLAYGELQDVRLLIPTLICACLRNERMRLTRGEQTRDVNYVGNIVAWLREIIYTPQDLRAFPVVNLASGREITVKDLAFKIRELCGSSSKLSFEMPYRKGEAMRFYADVTLLNRLTDLKEPYPLEEGLEKTVAWYRAHPDFSRE